MAQIKFFLLTTLLGIFALTQSLSAESNAPTSKTPAAANPEARAMLQPNIQANEPLERLSEENIDAVPSFTWSQLTHSSPATGDDPTIEENNTRPSYNFQDGLHRPMPGR